MSFAGCDELEEPLGLILIAAAVEDDDEEPACPVLNVSGLKAEASDAADGAEAAVVFPLGLDMTMSFSARDADA